MKCIICGAPMSFYFKKHFESYGLTEVDYHICPCCGFCASKTHFDMNKGQWEKLNADYHADNNRRTDNPYNRNQRYFYQALMLHLMARHQLIEISHWLDWGAGEGNFSIQLKSHFGLKMSNFDKYVKPVLHSLTIRDLLPRGYNLVLNSGIFEHVRNRETLDEIESYVKKTGCLAVHTLVRGAVPKDPEWMYLLPVHCAFHTNKSMQILMDAWGYKCSVYNEPAKMWMLMRQPPEIVEAKVERFNNAIGWKYLHYKSGFMDFWP